MNTKTFSTPLHKFAAALAALALLAIAAPAFAQSSGEFTYVIGTVTIERNGQRITPCAAPRFLR
jgi:ABC-type sugar transport system substrate-binding protein